MVCFTYWKLRGKNKIQIICFVHNVLGYVQYARAEKKREIGREALIFMFLIRNGMRGKIRMNVCQIQSFSPTKMSQFYFKWKFIRYFFSQHSTNKTQTELLEYDAHHSKVPGWMCYCS